MQHIIVRVRSNLNFYKLILFNLILLLFKLEIFQGLEKWKYIYMENTQICIIQTFIFICIKIFDVRYCGSILRIFRADSFTKYDDMTSY